MSATNESVKQKMVRKHWSWLHRIFLLPENLAHYDRETVEKVNAALRSAQTTKKNGSKE